MEKVKDYFSRNINSKRSLAKVKHLKDVFQLLEKRNFLNSKNVKLIQNLGDLLENEKINELVHTYQKLCLDDEFEAVPCAVCGNCFPNTEEPLGEHQNSNFNDMNNYEADTELCQAMDNIASNIGALKIGAKWGVLARALEIKEFQYDICTKTYPNDTVKQARMALQFWFEENKENANLQRLDKALEARLCKKAGFGVHLRLPIITRVPQF
ncbi:hypothetical protein JTE90_001812 [Oedothorax gibbosus]|uniref:Death domain-containing protein n=1 Tax=Oedothorax gibbosus TaxID=931172 RepID=A0AAV6VQC2_9ARAC|nr:hypothetical protein JTE90_001812 [Oedothorax gibbosus]